MSLRFDADYDPHKKKGTFILKTGIEDTEKYRIEIENMTFKSFADLSVFIRAYGAAREQIIRDFVIRKLRDLIYCLDLTDE
jgi:hypothetical protein